MKITRTTAWSQIQRWPLPEAAAGTALLAGFFAATAKDPGIYRSVLGLVYLDLLLFLAVYDIRTLRAPNRIVYPSLCLAAAASMTLGMGDAGEALLGGVAAFLTMFAIALAGRGAMGFGDVKVAALCGMAVGLKGVLPMLLVTFMTGGILAAVLLALRIRGRKDVVAFTPFMVGATAFCMFYQELYLWG
ncbi:MAG: prepilin peptidase [SAR202 cluster bacterium]|nr:prepilin peptidase [SAR202 cluster bacterium]